MRSIKRHLIILVLALFCLHCYRESVVNVQKLKEYNTLVTFKLNPAFNIDDSNQMLNKSKDLEEPIPLTFWGNINKAQISNLDLQKNAEVELIIANGRTDLLYPNNTFLENEDLDGCIINKSTAIALFGVSNAEGLSITYENKNYTIRGILNIEKDVMIIETVAIKKDNSSNVNLDMVTAHVDTTQSLNSIKNKLSNEYEITGEILEYRLLTEFTHLLNLIVPTLIWILLLKVIYKSILEVKFQCNNLDKNESKTKYIKQLIVWWTIYILVFIICAYLILREIHIPQDYIPTNWSDMSFWSQLYKSKKESLDMFLTIEKRNPQIYYMNIFVKAIKYSILSIVFCSIGSYIYGAKNFRKINTP